MAIEDYYRPLTVQATTQAVDAYGDTTTGYTDARAIVGAIVPASQQQAFIAAQRGITKTATLYAPTDCGVVPFDIVSDGQQRFQVVSEPVDHMHRGHHIEADLNKWQGGARDASAEK